MLVHTIYFRFNGRNYEESYSMTMGSPLSPVLMNLFMEEFELRLQRAYNKHDIHLFYKAGYTIRNVVVCLKDPLDPVERCGVVYECKCEQCCQLYVCKMERSLG